MNAVELIRAQRVLGLTNEELAETLGFETKAISRWRCGVNQVPARAAERINELLSIPPAAREPHLRHNTMKYRRAG